MCIDSVYFWKLWCSSTRPLFTVTEHLSETPKLNLYCSCQRCQDITTEAWQDSTQLGIRTKNNRKSMFVKDWTDIDLYGLRLHLATYARALHLELLYVPCVEHYLLFIL